MHQARFRGSRLKGRGLPVITVLLGLALLLAQLAAVSESIHGWLHSNAAPATHFCAAVLLSTGQVDAADASPILLPPADYPVRQTTIPESFPSNRVSLLRPARAPPRLG